MKQIISFVLTIAILLSASLHAVCIADGTSFRYMDDPKLQEYLADSVYDAMLTELDSDEYAITNIQTTYLSQEYIEELEYNSKMNVYFGFTLAELDAQFQGTKYVFTLGSDGQTEVIEFIEYKDNTFSKVVSNIAIGTGVILVCVTVSAVSAGAGAPAVSMIFAVAAKTGATCALSGAAIGGVAAGIVTGIQTGSMDEALKSAALGASEGYKWGAISGAVTGAASETVGLYRATLGPGSELTMNQVALIQKDSKLPLAFIKHMHSMEEYNLYKQCGLEALSINGNLAYLQPVNLNLVDEFGRTNTQRILNGLSPIDDFGVPFELHHIGQAADSPLAILTSSQHRGAGNFSILHFNTGAAESEIDREIFAEVKHEFWMNYLEKFGGV